MVYAPVTSAYKSVSTTIPLSNKIAVVQVNKRLSNLEFVRLKWVYLLLVKLIDFTAISVGAISPQILLSLHYVCSAKDLKIQPHTWHREDRF